MASSNQQVVFSRGIYHGLPTFPEEHKNLTAIVTGANGISGAGMIKALGEAPERWGKIYCMSRRPPAIKMPKNAEFIQSDLLKDPKEIGALLKEKGVSADYVFFYAYIQAAPKEGGGLWSDADEMVRLNKALFINFLQGLDVAAIKPKKVMLQTGAKYYGLHLGPTKGPMEEWFPRTELEPNFYHPQEDFLFDWCRKHSISWNVAMPSYIIGATPGAQMSLAYPLAIYAAVSAHLGEPLEYPGDINHWQLTQRNSSALLDGYFEEWLVLTKGIENQRFNASDGTVWTWEMMWPRVAGWYGIPYNGPVEGAEYKEIQTPYKPPPRGYGPPGKVRLRFSTLEWAKSKKVQDAWKQLAQAHNLSSPWLDDIHQTFAFLDGALLSPSTSILSTDKARKNGWHGYVDSYEGMLEAFEDLVEFKMIPPVPKVKVSFS